MGRNMHTDGRPGDAEKTVRHRVADNWRVLLAIANDLGRGDEARAIAVERAGKRLDEGTGSPQLLADIRAAFRRLKVDRIGSPGFC